MALIYVAKRHLQRYVAGWASMAPPRSPATAKARLTKRRWVLRQNLRNQRTLRLHGHERGWTRAELTPEDEARVDRLLR